MTSPQPPAEGPQKPDYGGQLDRESLVTETLSGARWVGGSRVVAEALALATTVLLARLVSPAEYGIAVIVLILPTLATVLTYEGFGAFLVQRRSCTREQVGSAVLLSIASGSGLAALVFFLAPVVAEPVFGADTSELAQLCAPIFLIASFGAVPRALLQRRLDWKWLNVTEIVQLIAVSVASLALAAAGLGAEALVLGALVGAAVATAVLLAAAPSGLPLWDRRSATSILKFGMPAAVSGLTGILQGSTAFLVLGGVARPEQVGLFWRAYQLGVEYQSKISSITYKVAKPVLMRADRIEDLREIRTRLVRINTTLIYPLLALLIVLAPDIVPWIFGPDWSGAVVPTQVLAVAGLWAILLTGIDPPLMAVGRPGALAIFNVGMVLAIGMTTWLTAPLGITAVAVGVAVCFGVMLLAGQFFLLRSLVGVPMRESLGEGAAALACSCILLLATLPVAAVLRASVDPLPLVLAVSALGLPIYAVCLRIASPSAWGDLRMLFVRVLGALRPVQRRASRASATHSASAPARSVGG